MGPHAPFPCEVSPLGRQWFSLQSWSTDHLIQGAETALPYLENYINSQQKTYNIAPENTLLCGFSQGAMVALYGALKGLPLAGVIAYSGAILWPHGAVSHNCSPLMLVHGNQDEVVPIEAFYASKKRLQELSVAHEAHEIRDLGHGIDDRALSLGLNFCRTHFSLL